MKKSLLLGAAGLALAAAASPASAQSPLLPFPGLASPTESTMSFRAEALRSDAYEIEAARVALDRSRDPRVRSYAREMIRDHQKTTDALLPTGYSLNATGNVVRDEKDGPFDTPLGFITAPLTIPVNIVGRTLGGESLIDNKPNEPGKRVALDPRRQAMLQQLATSSNSRAFNRTYTKQQVQSHQEAVALYAGYAQNGDEEEGRVFAGQALPGLQMHLEQANRLDARYRDDEAAF
jgi:predicted outer membrane protein